MPRLRIRSTITRHRNRPRAANACATQPVALEEVGAVVEVTTARKKRIAKFIEPLRVEPGTKIHLSRDFDPGYRSDVVRKRNGRELLQTGIELLAEYQVRLAAEKTRGV